MYVSTFYFFGFLYFRRLNCFYRYFKKKKKKKVISQLILHLVDNILIDIIVFTFFFSFLILGFVEMLLTFDFLLF